MRTLVRQQEQSQAVKKLKMRRRSLGLINFDCLEVRVGVLRGEPALGRLARHDRRQPLDGGVGHHDRYLPIHLDPCLSLGKGRGEGDGKRLRDEDDLEAKAEPSVERHRLFGGQDHERDGVRERAISRQDGGQVARLVEEEGQQPRREPRPATRKPRLVAEVEPPMQVRLSTVGIERAIGGLRLVRAIRGGCGFEPRGAYVGRILVEGASDDGY